MKPFRKYRTLSFPTHGNIFETYPGTLLSDFIYFAPCTTNMTLRPLLLVLVCRGDGCPRLLIVMTWVRAACDTRVRLVHALVVRHRTDQFSRRYHWHLCVTTDLVGGERVVCQEGDDIIGRRSPTDFLRTLH